MAKEDSEKKNVDIALQSVEVEKEKREDFRKKGNIKRTAVCITGSTQQALLGVIKIMSFIICLHPVSEHKKRWFFSSTGLFLKFHFFHCSGFLNL